MPTQTRSKELRQIDKSFLKCRTLGHAWRWSTVDRKGRSYIQHLRCTSCDTEKRQQLDSKGFIVANAYSYAPGYLVKGLGYLDKDDRAALRLRFLVGTGQVDE